MPRAQKPTEPEKTDPGEATAKEVAPVESAPILDGPKPALPPEAKTVDKREAEARLTAAHAQLRKSREDACQSEVDAVLKKHNCIVKPMFGSKLVPMGDGPNGQAIMGAAVVFGGFDIVSA